MRTDWKIRAAVVGWLRYQRRCPLVMWERNVFGGLYVPDIMGVQKNRTVIEVEVKRTMSDFRANTNKRFLEIQLCQVYQFYFAVPIAMVDAVLKEIPDGVGLLTLAMSSSQYGPEVRCVRKARVNKTCQRLTMKKIVEAAMHQTGSLHRAAVAVSKYQAREAV